MCGNVDNDPTFSPFLDSGVRGIICCCLGITKRRLKVVSGNECFIQLNNIFLYNFHFT